MEITRTTGECLHSPVVLVIFMYGDCHGREAASRHRGSCLLLFSIWRLPWPRGSVAASRLLLVAFFCMATAMAERQRPASRLLLVAFFYMATAMAERQRPASRLLLVAFFCMATAMAERQHRGIEALACCFFLYGDCHGRKAASQKLCSYATICGSPSICANQHSSPSSIFTLPLVPSVISASTVFTSPKGNKTLNSTFSV